MSTDIERGRIGWYAAAFACALVAGLLLAISGMTKSLGAGYSWASVVFSVLAIVLAIASVLGHST